jgi:hypothetical protein
MLGETLVDNASVVLPSFSLVFLIERDEFSYNIIAMGDSFYYENLSIRKGSKGSSKLIYKRIWNKSTKRWTLTIGTKMTDDDALIKEIKYVNSMEISPNLLLLNALLRRGKHSYFENMSRWVNLLGTSRYRTNNNLEVGYLQTDDSNPDLKILNDPKIKRKLLEFLVSLNPHICGYRLEKNASSLGKQDGGCHLIFEYNNNLKSEVKRTDELLTLYESKGIFSAFTLLPSILNVLKNGGLIVVDELESSLHPLLMAKVINMFTDPDINTGGGQLIFTTHNALIMDNKYLRQDEIGFVEKDEEGKSEFYKLSDVEGVRSDLDFCKNYILGAFGAIPRFE